MWLRWQICNSGVGIYTNTHKNPILLYHTHACTEKCSAPEDPHMPIRGFSKAAHSSKEAVYQVIFIFQSLICLVPPNITLSPRVILFLNLLCCKGNSEGTMLVPASLGARRLRQSRDDKRVQLRQSTLWQGEKMTAAQGCFPLHFTSQLLLVSSSCWPKPLTASFSEPLHVSQRTCSKC